MASYQPQLSPHRITLKTQKSSKQNTIPIHPFIFNLKTRTTNFLLIDTKENLMKNKEAFEPYHGVEVHIDPNHSNAKLRNARRKRNRRS